QHYNRQHVIRALHSLQLTFRPKYIPGQKTNINTDAFKSALLNSMAKLENVAIPKTMNQIDSKTINFVEMIFGAFLRDKNVSDAIKELLLSMQIPIIKVALLDSKFFNNEKHPARHVLNSIAHIGIGIEDKENKIYQTMQYIIEQLLQSFEENMDVFNTTRLSLDRLANIEKSKHEQTEKQTRQLITLEYTRQLVLKELQYYTHGVTIPKPLQPLILSHWATLMYQRYTSFGKDSIEWREAVGILRLLVKTFKPINSKEDWLALRSLYKGLVNSVRSCLNDSRQNKEKTFIATSNLNNYYSGKITESEFFTENVDDGSADSFDAMDSFNSNTQMDMDLSPMDKQSRKSRDIIASMPEFIKPNNWFEVFTDYSHPVRRLKLSVILKEQARLAFVDYMGNKVIEKDIEQFLTELHNDQSRQINDHSIFEYALSMVIISIAARS
ncbi:MAG: DUF1631 family protein, partial [Gammaproteobacteria bacterium]